MTATHTAGPWRAHRIGPGYVVTTAERGRPTDIHDVAYVPDIDIGHTEANARLIAAAPDLLAACREAIELLEAEEPATDFSVDRLKAAIAKATGAERPVTT